MPKSNPPINYMPPDYIPSLNSPLERPSNPNGGGCLKSLIIGLIFLSVIAGLFWYGISFFIPKNYEVTITLAPTLSSFEELYWTNTPVPTLDDWSATGTALLYATASPTLDYCWFLTPTATASPTLIYTPDAWQRTGTAVHLATNPPQTIIPQPTTPRSWCDYQTPTFTPLALTFNNSSESTAIPSATTTPSATSTHTATLVISVGGGGGLPQPTAFIIQPTSAPATAVILPTSIPPTKKPKKTKTPTLTPIPAPNFYLIYAGCDFIIFQSDADVTARWSFEAAGAFVSGESSNIKMPSSAVVTVPAFAEKFYIEGVLIAELHCAAATATPSLTATPSATSIMPELTLEPVVTPTPEGLS